MLGLRKVQPMKNTLIALLTIILLAVSPVAFAAGCSLCEPVKKGNLPAIKRLLDKNAKVNAKDLNGYTPLMWAARASKNDILNLLLSRGANINVKDKRGNTPLLLAARYSKSKVVKSLLNRIGKRVGGVNAQDKKGNTPLLWAVKKNKSKVVTLLLQYGANPDIRNNKGTNAWELAKKRRKIFTILKKYRDSRRAIKR